MSRLALTLMLVLGSSSVAVAQGGAPNPLPGLPAGCTTISGDFTIDALDDVAISGTLTGDVEGSFAGTVTDHNTASMGFLTITVARFTATVTTVDGTAEVTGRVIQLELVPPMGGPSIPMASIEGMKMLITGGTGALDGAQGIIAGFHVTSMNAPAGLPDGYNGVLCLPVPAPATP